MPLLIRFGLDNYAHAQTVDTRPFFLGRVGPGNEATNHQLSFLLEGLLWTFLLIFKPSILQKREIAFLIDFVVVCFIVPQTLRAPSTLTLGPLLATVCCLDD